MQSTGLLRGLQRAVKLLGSERATELLPAHRQQAALSSLAHQRLQDGLTLRDFLATPTNQPYAAVRHLAAVCGPAMPMRLHVDTC